MIRMLGGLEVLRPDGALVEPREWRTGKTADLLRLLALENDRPVRVGSLLATLWPDAPVARAQGSLRTASSQIRRAIGTHCVVRQPDSLVLEGAWVDVGHYHRNGADAAAAARAGDLERVLALTRIAERHYRGDFHAHDDLAAWAVAERERLALRRHDMLCDAADAALTLGRPRDALDFASTAARATPSSETAHRALMRAHADLGEVGAALRVYEGYRRHLADELGADPSEQTRALHLGLLRGHGD
ncbi:AfsR/SARP family transcriptional regulator [Nocardioides dongxiaopingii]|uniref:AfsR/SARP family transcriptional regulator n=1 Tax=Nocardioides dongxiaopingii TaxID=2576036 RepID=UPI0010C765EC|nr:BTAD domain-containing protein [Nocardioides dongxiaopingii]